MKAGESPLDQDSSVLSRKYDPEDRNRRGGALKGVSRPASRGDTMRAAHKLPKARLSALLHPSLSREAHTV
jgi:hypothetical protein